jgi:hypothetical protein
VHQVCSKLSSAQSWNRISAPDKLGHIGDGKAVKSKEEIRKWHRFRSEDLELPTKKAIKIGNNLLNRHLCFA